MSAPASALRSARLLLSRWARDRRGVSAIEFTLIAPLLVMLLFGGATIFTFVRDSRTAERATYTVADILARRFEVSTKQLETDHAMFLAITRQTAENVRLRVTSLKKAKDKFVIDWAWAMAPQTQRTEIKTIEAQLPLVAEGDSVLFLETSVTSRPLFSALGFSSLTFDFLSANRPRFVAIMPKTD